MYTLIRTNKWDVFCLQEDCAKDDDLHSVIADKLDKNFTCTRKAKFPDQEAAVSLMTVSLLFLVTKIPNVFKKPLQWWKGGKNLTKMTKWLWIQQIYYSIFSQLLWTRLPGTFKGENRYLCKSLAQVQQMRRKKFSNRFTTNKIKLLFSSTYLYKRIQDTLLKCFWFTAYRFKNYAFRAFLFSLISCPKLSEFPVVRAHENTKNLLGITFPC